MEAESHRSDLSVSEFWLINAFRRKTDKLTYSYNKNKWINERSQIQKWLLYYIQQVLEQENFRKVIELGQIREFQGWW